MKTSMYLVSIPADDSSIVKFAKYCRMNGISTVITWNEEGLMNDHIKMVVDVPQDKISDFLNKYKNAKNME